ncbi:hypothetical protein FDECE_40 [Fusarium decemcellulare]|nr:hypothetical protein FDECE_40 [Fusarium decemcellulare]
MSHRRNSSGSQPFLNVPPRETPNDVVDIAVIRGEAVKDLPRREAGPGTTSARSGLGTKTKPKTYKEFMLGYLAQTFGADHLSSTRGKDDDLYSSLTGTQFSRDKPESSDADVLEEIEARRPQPALVPETERSEKRNVDGHKPPETSARPREHEAVDLKDVRNELAALAKRSGSNPFFFPSYTKEFVSDIDLWRYMTESRVRSILDQCGLESTSSDEKDFLASKICAMPQSKTDITFKSYRKILALLVRIQKEGQIRRFVEEGLHDALLPLAQVDGPDGSVQLVLDERSGPHPCFDGWDQEHIKYFSRIQWELCAPFFKPDNDDLRHYIFPENIALPFLATGGKAAEGATGSVAKVRLAEDHGNLRTRQTGERKRLFAVKKLNRPDRNAFEGESHALGRLNKIRKQHERETSKTTKHIAMMAATFEVNCGDISSFYLVFPCAEGNLRDFWNDYSNPDDQKKHVRDICKWMAEQFHGLASALDILHDIYDHLPEFDDDPKNHGIHGDIKPENILRFMNWDGDLSKFGVLQLADFGLTKYHHTATVNQVDPHLRYHVYCPPEVQFNWKTDQSLDTWALGCLFLEFCVWLIFGNKGLEDFKDDRTVFLNSPIKVTYFYASHGSDEPGCWPFGSVDKKLTLHEGVVQWAKNMHKLDWVPKFIHDLVDIVVNDILVLRNDPDEPPATADNSKQPSQVQGARTLGPSQRAVPVNQPRNDLPHVSHPLRRQTTVLSEPSPVPPPRKRFWSTETPKKRITASQLREKLNNMIKQDDPYFSEGYRYDMSTFTWAKPFRYSKPSGKQHRNDVDFVTIPTNFTSVEHRDSANFQSSSDMGPRSEAAVGRGNGDVHHPA